MKILIALFAGLLALLFRVRKALAFDDANINTAGFVTANTIPEYKDGGSRQWGARVANNTAYNFRHSDQNLFLQNDEFVFASESQKTREYDTDRNYVNAFVAVRLNAFNSSQGLPFTAAPIERQDGNDDSFLNVVYLQLTTSMQNVIGEVVPVDDRIDIGTHNARIAMRARNMADGGGIEIQVTIQTTVSLTVYVIGTIKELRNVTGSDI